MNSLGKATKTTLLSLENDKLALEFEVATAAINQGQPVKLTAAGKITAWAQADGVKSLLGIAHKAGAVGDLVTVHCRGYVLKNAYAAGALDAGPVTWASFDSSTDVGGTTGYHVYEASTADSEIIAFNLVQTAGAGLIQVLVLG